MDFPEAGIQIPGGTIESGELPEDAVLREAVEETGLERLHLVSYLGSDEYHLSSTHPEEIHLRYFFHLRCQQDVPENWQHHERHPSDGSPGPILFDFYWLPLTEAGRVLPPYFTAKLKIVEQLGLEILFEGQFKTAGGGSVRFAYLDTRQQCGIILELINIKLYGINVPQTEFMMNVGRLTGDVVKMDV